MKTQTLFQAQTMKNNPHAKSTAQLAESLSEEHFEILMKVAAHLNVTYYEAAQHITAKFGIYAPLFYDFCVDFLNTYENWLDEEIEL